MIMVPITGMYAAIAVIVFLFALLMYQEHRITKLLAGKE